MYKVIGEKVIATGIDRYIKNIVASFNVTSINKNAFKGYKNLVSTSVDRNNKVY